MVHKEEVYEFLESQKLAVVSSVNSKGKPESAIVGFGNTKKLEIIFGTDINTRKAHNIKFNNHVSLVINGDKKCIQYEGQAHLLFGQEREEFLKIFFVKVPTLSKYAMLTNQIYYKVIPKWIRIIDHNFSPGKVSEMDF